MAIPVKSGDRDLKEHGVKRLVPLVLVTLFSLAAASMSATVNVIGRVYLRSAGNALYYGHAGSTHVKYCNKALGSGLYGDGQCYETTAYNHTYDYGQEVLYSLTLPGSTDYWIFVWDDSYDYG